MKIGDFTIDNESPVFIIAELSANHNGSLDNALATIKSAKRAGADCIKLQTYTADTLTLDSDKEDFVITGTIWEGKKYHELYQEAYTPWEWHQALFDVAKEEGLICFSSPFDKSAVDFLENLDVPAYKIASFDKIMFNFKKKSKSFEPNKIWAFYPILGHLNCLHLEHPKHYIRSNQ